MFPVPVCSLHLLKGLKPIRGTRQLMSFTAGIPIYYGYDGSPFVAKLETMLLLKNIPARRVDVSLYPPRPQLVNQLGVLYRRVPVLALGRDIYIDTALIASVLERHFPETHGHPTLYPPRKGTNIVDIGLQKAFTRFYAEKHLFQIGFALVPWSKLPKDVQDDRKKFIGGSVDFYDLEQKRVLYQNSLSLHLTMVEQQLFDSRDWLLDTSTPGLIDASLYTVLAWSRSFRSSKSVFNPKFFPKAVAWLDRMEAILKQKQHASPPLLSKMDGEDAAKEILASPFLDISDVGFDEDEAKKLDVTLGCQVSIRPDDTGKEVESTGKLIALNMEELIIETEAKAGGPGSVRVHFPRLGYIVRRESYMISKL